MFDIGDKVRILTDKKDKIQGEIREIINVDQYKKYKLEGNNSYYYRENELELVGARRLVEKGFELEVERVLHQDIATIVFFTDGTKEVVRCNNEEDDKEKAIAVAIAKRVLGGYTELKRLVDNAEGIDRPDIKVGDMVQGRLDNWGIPIVGEVTDVLGEEVYIKTHKAITVYDKIENIKKLEEIRTGDRVQIVDDNYANNKNIGRRGIVAKINSFENDENVYYIEFDHKETNCGDTDVAYRDDIKKIKEW